MKPLIAVVVTCSSILSCAEGSKDKREAERAVDAAGARGVDAALTVRDARVDAAAETRALDTRAPEDSAGDAPPPLSPDDAKGDGSGDAAASFDAGDAGASTGIAGVLDGYRLESPCDIHDEPTACKTLPAVDKQTHTIKLGGAPGTTYAVTLRVRGVVEPMAYTGGAQAGFFYVGGRPNNGSYNIYRMSVASPKQDHFFNARAINGDEIFKLDYTTTVKMEGGTAVTFVVNGQNLHQVSNFQKVVVDGVPPAPKAFDGQFIHLTVVSAVAQP